MGKVAAAIGMVFLIAALAVFGSPFFAALLFVPALLFYFALVGTAVVTDDEAPGDTSPADEPPTEPGPHEP